MGNGQARKRPLAWGAVWLAGFAALAAMAPAAAPPPAQRGVYAIWTGSKNFLLDLPYIAGGQVAVQWGDVESAGEGNYNWSTLDNALKKLYQHAPPLPTTVQLNGNRKPAWLFTQCPYNPAPLSIQVDDTSGTLMYWHPTFVRAYTNLLAAYAAHLKTSPYRSVVLGVRQNFDAIGTEQLNVPAAEQPLDHWIVPPGVDQGPQWTSAIRDSYEQTVLQTHVDQFPPEIFVFVRFSISDTLRAPFDTQFQTGVLGWFQTGSRPEPPGAGTESQYQKYFDNCRTGQTLGYAESYADAWGFHGGTQTPYPFPPPQSNYWRVLCDLNAGVSFVGVYGNDLNVAYDGTHGGDHTPWDPSYPDEFTRAFEFAAKYAGYHASPGVSPGAWVALRQGSYLPGDYTFLMQRLTDTSTEVQYPDPGAGPAEQRFSAWARQLPQGANMRFVLDAAFAASLASRRADLNVTYLDTGTGSISVTGGGATYAIALENTGRWRTDTHRLDSADFQLAGGAHVALSSPDQVLTLHMVEVSRVDAPPASVEDWKECGDFAGSDEWR